MHKNFGQKYSNKLQKYFVEIEHLWSVYTFSVNRQNRQRFVIFLGLNNLLTNHEIYKLFVAAIFWPNFKNKIQKRFHNFQFSLNLPKNSAGENMVLNIYVAF